MSDAAFRLFDRLQYDGLPIVFHNGMSASPDAVLRYAHPLAMDEVAIRFPPFEDDPSPHITPLVRGLHDGSPKTSQRVDRHLRNAV